MDFVVDQFRFLGLNTREIRVFTVISTFGKMNMTKISSRSQLPRTTVDAIVRRLLKQGLISKEKMSGHFEYFVQPTEVADKLDLLEQKLRPKKPSEKQKVAENEQKFIDEKNVTGVNYIDLLDNAFQNHRGDRVRLMLSHVQREGEKSCVERLQMYTKLAVENQIKFDVLMSPRIADVVRGKKHLFEIYQVPLDVRLNIVPAFYSIMEHDVCMFRDTVMLIHPHKNITEKIDSLTHVDLCNHLLTVASEVGWSVDLATWLNK
ncbi:MAG: hypothetical protein UU89_C0015G0012 [Parcubacteria group bacterium GW2011_GWC2_42_11]|nr:MAG: hypothetical protein UU89_C0015G0012 [Parcubacteria group bacterium GW2011_GWC2_42_11]